MLDNITLYWLSNTGASSARLYFESYATDFKRQQLDVPVGVSVFPGELYRPLKVWGERSYSNLFYWNEVTRGGHFAAFEQPDLFVAELRARTISGHFARCSAATTRIRSSDRTWLSMVVQFTGCSSAGI